MPSKSRRSGFTVGDQDQRRRGRGRSPGQRNQCWKWNVNLLDGPARRYHRQQWARGVVSDLYNAKIVSHHFPRACFSVYFFSFKKLVGLQEAGLRFVLSRRSDRLPHCGSPSPFPRLLLGVHRRGSFCSPAGKPERIFRQLAGEPGDQRSFNGAPPHGKKSDWMHRSYRLKSAACASRAKTHFRRKTTVSSSASFCRWWCGYSVSRSRAMS